MFSSSISDTIRHYWHTHPHLAAQARAEGVNTEAGHLPLKVMLFDMDGVLFDSMPAHALSWTTVSQEFGLPMTIQDAYMNEGRTAFTTINELTRRLLGRDTTPEEVERIYQRKCEVFNTQPPAPKMRGAEQALSTIAADKLPIVVVTGSGQESLLNRLTTNFPSFFEAELVVSAKDVKHGKPHPEPYLMGLEKASQHLHLDQLRPWEAMVIENAPLGVQSAVAAEIFTIAVNTGPLPPEALTQEGANLLLPSMMALHEAWAEIRTCFVH